MYLMKYTALQQNTSMVCAGSDDMSRLSTDDIDLWMMHHRTIASSTVAVDQLLVR